MSEAAIEVDVRRFKPYPAYKDSGVEWLGEVPVGWEVWKVSHGFSAVGSGTTPRSDDESYYDGDIPWVNTSELRETIILDTNKKLTVLALKDYSALKMYLPDSLLIAMYGATIGRMGILGISATMNQACCVLSNGISLDSRFAFYWFWMRRPILIALSAGGGQPNLSQDFLRSVRIPAPSLEEQQTIVAFLDRETAKIDALIAKKELLIELLKEKRLAVITHAVTKGLDPDVEMKDSGVEWLSEVPIGWEMWKVSHGFTTIGSGTTPRSDDESYYEGDVPWVNTSELRETIILDTNKKLTTSAISNYSVLKMYPPGSLLIAMYGATIGRMGILGISATVNQACCVLGDGISLDVRFAFYWFLMRRPILIALSAGGGQPNLSQDFVKSIRIPAPTLDDQHAIVAFLDQEAAKIDILIDRIVYAIEKLREYRTALIAAAVTGKIDVRKEAQME